MNKTELIKELSDNTGMPLKDVELILNSTMDMIVEKTMNNETVKFANFGVFYLNEKKEKIGASPLSGEKIVIPSKKIISFKISKKLRNKINQNE